MYSTLINNIFLYSLNTIINMIKSFAYLKNNLDGQFNKCVFLKMKVFDDRGRFHENVESLCLNRLWKTVQIRISYLI